MSSISRTCDSAVVSGSGEMWNGLIREIETEVEGQATEKPFV